MSPQELFVLRFLYLAQGMWGRITSYFVQLNTLKLFVMSPLILIRAGLWENGNQNALARRTLTCANAPATCHLLPVNF